jgi:hypothetical protein
MLGLGFYPFTFVTFAYGPDGTMYFLATTNGVNYLITGH